MAVAERLVGRVDVLLGGELFQNIVFVRPGKLIAVIDHCLRPHHMIHNEQALHTGIECFALQSAGVGNDFFCMLREMHRIGIPNWLRKNDVFKAVPLTQTQRGCTA